MQTVELADGLIFLGLPILDDLSLVDDDGVEGLRDIVIEMDAEHVVADKDELRGKRRCEA